MTACAFVAAALAPFNGYLLGLLGAALKGRRGSAPRPNVPGQLRFAVVVPAHDEEAFVGETLASLIGVDYPRAYVESIVIADNCSDRTAEVAAHAGATVWARRGGGGKGAALAWAFARLAVERPDVEAVVVVDADCTVAPNLLSAMEARIRAGASAVQAPYEVANPTASSTSALRYASFALINVVRPFGKATLGLSAGLLGTGMAFSRELLAALPWTACSLVEDQEYHLNLVAAGERVAFAPETWVRSPMPTSLLGSKNQQLRWEAGRGRLIRSWTPRLLGAGLRSRDPVRLHAALEPFVPPQSFLLAANAASAGIALSGSRATRRVGLANLAAQAVFVTGGLALTRAPAAVWRALLCAPMLALWKLALVGRLWLGGQPTAWVRTTREPKLSQPPMVASRRTDSPFFARATARVS
jgi:Glycosyltransferase like family 2